MNDKQEQECKEVFNETLKTLLDGIQSSIGTESFLGSTHQYERMSFNDASKEEALAYLMEYTEGLLKPHKILRTEVDAALFKCAYDIASASLRFGRDAAVMKAYVKFEEDIESILEDRKP